MMHAFLYHEARKLVLQLGCVAVLVLCFPLTMFAGQSDRLLGWAWSDNIGWISMNCTNTNSCTTVDYGVTFSETGGSWALTGWAWSDNIGWIDFSQASVTAVDRSLHGDGTVHATIAEPYCDTTDPYQTDTMGDVEPLGGAYICTDSSDNDGWNGVISFSDTTPVSYGPVADAVDDTADGWDWDDDQYYLMDGYAWGGEVVGWIKFSCQDSDGGGADTNTCGSVGYGVFMEPFFFDLTASAGVTALGALDYDGSTSFIWTLAPDIDITSCVAGYGIGSWMNTPSKATNPSPISELVTNITDPFPGATSSLTCTNNDNKSLTRELYIYIKPPPPIITFTATDYNIPYNSSTTLVWTTENIASCTASAGDSGWTGSIATGTNQTYGTENLTAQTTTYNMTCLSSYPTYYTQPALQTLDITVQKLLVDFYAEDDDGNKITTPTELFAYTEKDNISLVWETEFATGGCTAGGDWSGTKVVPEVNNDIVNGNELATIPDGGTFTYTLSCYGEFGQQIDRAVTIRISRNPEFSEEITNDLQ